MARLPGDILRDIHLGLGALSPADKAKVAEVLVDDLSGMGRVTDRDLAHITPAEAIMLREAGGAGTLNPETGLPEYYGPGTAPGVSPGVSPGPGPGPGSSPAMGFGPTAVAQGLAALGLGTGSSAPGSTGTGTGMTTTSTRGSTTSQAADGGESPGQMLGITPAEVSSIVSSLTAESGDAGTSPAFQFADTTRGDTPSDTPVDSNVIVDKDVLFDADRIADKINEQRLDIPDKFLQRNILPETALYNLNEQERALELYREKWNQDRLESYYWQERQMERTRELAELMNKYKLDQADNFDLSKNIDNPYLPDKLNPLDRTVLKTEDGNTILTSDLNPVDFSNLSIENMINRYINEAAEKNPTMYGMENYFKPYETISEQFGFDSGSWLSRTEKAAKDSWVARQTSDLGSWISNNIGKVADFVGERAPIMSFLSRSPLGVIKSFIAEMLSKQTPALRDKTRMYLAAQSYVQRGLKIPEISDLAAHDFSAQPYLGEETFTDQWKTLPTFERVRGLEEEDRLEQERIQKKLEEEFRAAQLEELSKYFDTVSDEYLSLRDQPTYNPQV